MADWVASPGRALHGAPAIPGDKSVSHRAVMLAAIAEGVSRIDGFLEGADALATCAAFERMGVRIATPGHGVRIVHGVGLHGLRAPGGVPPLMIRGGAPLRGIDFASEVASAQVKSAVLLAGLYADGRTRVRESRPTRDYTERMLEAFGADIGFAPGEATVRGGAVLRATDVAVPADFSSAAFLLVAATLVPGSSLVLPGIGIDPRRTGLLRVLRAMGADITEVPCGVRGGLAVADLHVRHAPLHGIEVPDCDVADMIDEFPVLFVAASCAQGRTVVRGAAELRVKESDRIATMAAGLRALGMRVDEAPDGATIHGGRLQGGRVDSHGDHRVAMAFAVAGQRAAGEVRIDDVANVATSFPGFDAVARGVGFGLSAAR